MTTTIFRTIFFYFFVTFSYRIMGKREIGQLGVIDLIVSLLIAEIVAISIERIDQSILYAVLPISVLVLLELVLGYFSLKSRLFNKIFLGKPTVIINKGKIIYKNLISQRYSIDDLLLELRKKGFKTIEDIEYAFLEPDGSLSLFSYDKGYRNSEVPLPVIIEGTIQYEVLELLKKDKYWINRILSANNLKLEQVFYAIYKYNHLYIIKKTF